MMVADVSTDAQFSVRARRGLFSIAQFNTSRGEYDVLPGDAGFLMLQTDSSVATKGQFVFVDRWTTLLSAAKGRR